jgi:uncharacterized protein YndB with AHSA1/START domain
MSILLLFTAMDMSIIGSPERVIRFEIDIEAPVIAVWKSWTTAEGIRTFFAPASNVELRVLGPYEIYFSPDAEPGFRGAEGNVVLAIQEGKMLSFTWDAPPLYPEVRKQRTSIVLRFIELTPDRTKLVLTQTGWGTGEEWDKVFEYFIEAWGSVVLPRCKYSLEIGPVDWSNPVRNLEKAVRIE